MVDEVALGLVSPANSHSRDMRPTSENIYMTGAQTWTPQKDKKNAERRESSVKKRSILENYMEFTNTICGQNAEF
jgi:hypothetical protein